MSIEATSSPDRSSITGVILAGGRARRMGGEDKGLVAVAGRPMVCHVADALRPQVRHLVVNANRNVERYAALTGCRVVEDSVEGYAGPLAGMLSALGAIDTPLLVTAPCDSPLIAPDLVERLRGALDRDGADLAVAHDGRRQQPVFLLLRAELGASIQAFLESGERKIDLWFASHRVAEADLSDSPETFSNVNTPEEREALERHLAKTDTC